MTALSSIAWPVFVFAMTITASFAGPCTAEIDLMRARVEARLESIVASGPSAAQGPAHRQPTPRSLAATEEKLGGLPQEKIDAVRQAMKRAGDADKAGDKNGCEQALADVKGLIGP